MYTLDTNAIIYYLKNDRQAVLRLEKILARDFAVYISAITEVELFGFSSLTNQEIEKIDNLLETLAIIPLDSRLARLAGFLRRQYQLKTPDSIIAATATFTGTKLVTRNIRDFQRIPHLQLLRI